VWLFLPLCFYTVITNCSIIFPEVKNSKFANRSSLSPYYTPASSAQKLREKIYREPLPRPQSYRPASSYISPKNPRKAKRRGQVLQRHHTAAQYDPDYNYINPDEILASTRQHMLSNQVSRTFVNLIRKLKPLIL